MLLVSTGGEGWSVETVDLWLTSRSRAGATEPLGDGPQLLVRRYGRVVGYFADLAGLRAAGVDMARMAVAASW